MKFYIAAVFVGLMLHELHAQPLYTPQANIGRRKWYFNLGGDIQKVQELAKQQKADEAIREAEITFIYNTKPQYQTFTTRKWLNANTYIEKTQFIQGSYKMHSVYFRAIGRHLPIFSAKADTTGKGFAAEFNAQSIISTEKSSAITAGWLFSSNKQESGGRATNLLNGYKAIQKRIFVEFNYGASSRTDTILATRGRVHAPTLTVGGQWLRTTAGKLNAQRDRVFAELGVSAFVRSSVVYKEGVTGYDLGEQNYVSVTGGGVRLHLMVDIPAATLDFIGTKTNATFGAYAEAVSLYAAGVANSPLFVNSGGKAVHFQWGFMFNVPIYGSEAKNFNRPAGIEADISPGTLN